MYRVQKIVGMTAGQRGAALLRAGVHNLFPIDVGVARVAQGGHGVVNQEKNGGIRLGAKRLIYRAGDVYHKGNLSHIAGALMDVLCIEESSLTKRLGGVQVNDLVPGVTGRAVFHAYDVGSAVVNNIANAIVRIGN